MSFLTQIYNWCSLFIKRKTPRLSFGRFLSSGEGGIRTHGTLRYSRSPGARIRPDYATSPSVPYLGKEYYTRTHPSC